MSSRRLPGKSLADLRGRPMLSYVLESLERARRLDAVVVATSVEPSDDPIAAFCADRGTPCLRGPLGNVAERFGLAARRLGLEAFVRVCGDSPLLDHRLADRCVELFLAERPDVACNVFPRRFPAGQSVEVVSARTFLRELPRFAEPDDAEHVTRYFYRQAERFAIVSLEAAEDCRDCAMAVDQPEDLERTRRMLEAMDRPHWEYPLAELAALHPARTGGAAEAGR